MQLTREENEMLEGKYGYPVQKSMEILVGLGECYDAKIMIPVASAHLVAGFKMGKAGALFYEEMAKMNKGPSGMINLRAKSIVMVGAILSDIPVVDRLDGNPLELIKTGDQVEMDADRGIVKVRKQ